MIFILSQNIFSNVFVTLLREDRVTLYGSRLRSGTWIRAQSQHPQPWVQLDCVHVTAATWLLPELHSVVPNMKSTRETQSEDSLQKNSPKICECVKKQTNKQKMLRKYSRLKKAKEHNNCVQVSEGREGNGRIRIHM